MHSWHHADSEHVSFVVINGKGTEITGNKHIHSLINILNFIYQYR